VLSTSKDYTDKDFDALRARLISLIKSIPEFSDWTDFAVADIGNILMEAFSFVGDVLAFNLDGASREAKWGTATQLRSILRLAKQIDYRPKGATAATVTETIRATGTLAADVLIPAGTVIQTKDASPVAFQTLTDITLTPGAPSDTVDVENSKTVTETSEASSEAFQTFSLGQVPFLSGSLVVTTSQGSWTLVDNFLASSASDLHYTLDVDAGDQGTVMFGDGTTGAKPIGTITRRYKLGGGSVGMVSDGVITDIQGTFYDTLGNRVELVATNSAKTVGGDEKEAVSTIKVRAPAFIKAGNRTVCREDFEFRARNAAGVGRALHLTRKEDEAVDPNTGLLWIVPQGLGFLTPTIRAAITAEFVKYPYAPSFYLQIMDPWYLDVSSAAKVYFQGSAKKNVVKTAIAKALTDFFALTTSDAQGNVIDNSNVDFGYYYQDGDGAPTGLLPYADLFALVEGIPGVRKVGGNPEDFLLSSAVTNTQGTTALETNVHKDLAFGIRQFPRFVGITLVDGDTGSTL